MDCASDMTLWHELRRSDMTLTRNRSPFPISQARLFPPHSLRHVFPGPTAAPSNSNSCSRASLTRIRSVIASRSRKWASACRYSESSICAISRSSRKELRVLPVDTCAIGTATPVFRSTSSSPSPHSEQSASLVLSVWSTQLKQTLLVHLYGLHSRW